MTTILYGVIALFPLGISALVFLYHTINSRSSHKSILQNFNLLMTFFMGGWFITELLEVVAVPAIAEEVHYIHFAIMMTFALALTWRWRWAKKLSRPDYVATEETIK